MANRDRLADFLCAHVGMHVIERTDDFTLVGADARRGKLTLFAAEGERDAGVLERVVLRVSDLARALAALPTDTAVERPSDELALFDAPEGLRLGLRSVPGTDLDYDIDHVVLRVPDPAQSFEGFVELGFERKDGRLVSGDKALELRQGEPDGSARPLLNHLAVLVDSGAAQLEEAKRKGIEVAEVRDTSNVYAVFVWGPDRIKLEYVEHKPSFSLV